MFSAGSIVTESLTCSICSELLNEPKLLSCTHTFCKKCLHALLSSQRPEQSQVPCPTCRQVTHLENGDVSKLQTNVPINSLLEELKSARKYCTVRICDAEAKLLALFYCWQCNEFLCGSCHIAHGKFKKISSHDVVNVGDVKSGKVRVKHFCELHPHEELEFVCSPCKIPICFRCRVFDHSGGEHQVVDILAFQKTIQSQAKSLQDKSEKKISAIEAHIGGVDEHLVKVGSVLDERVAKIHQTYDNFLHNLTKKRNELSDEIQQQRQLMVKELEDIKEMNIKSLARIKSLYEIVTKATEGFMEGDALVAHNKVCYELEEMLKIDDPDDKGVKDIAKRAEGLKLRVYQGNRIFSMPIAEVYQEHGNQSALSSQIASTKADLDWNLEKMNSLSVAGAKFSDMAPTPDGKMAVGYQLGGIDVFSLHGLDETVLQDVNVNSVAVLSDGRYVVRCMNKKVYLFDCDWEFLCDVATNCDEGALYLDQQDNLYVSKHQYGNCTVFTLVSEAFDSDGDEESERFERFEEVKDINGGWNEIIPLNHQNDLCICIDHETNYVKVRYKRGGFLYERNFSNTPRVAVLEDDTVLIGWGEGGHVTVELYTYQLSYVKAVLSDFKIDGESFKLSEFSTGEIALCDGKALHFFRKSH